MSKDRADFTEVKQEVILIHKEKKPFAQNTKEVKTYYPQQARNDRLLREDEGILWIFPGTAWTFPTLPAGLQLGVPVSRSHLPSLKVMGSAAPTALTAYISV